MKKTFTLTAVFFISLVSSFAQGRKISGRVVDDKGDPVPFATIRLKDSKKGVSADEGGAFNLTVNPGNILLISATGFSPKEQTLKNEDNVTITLNKTSDELVSVVVTAFGIKRAPKELGYSTQRLSASEINQGHVTNVANGLTGKVSGLSIQTQNNGVNPDLRINLRGNRSLLGNNQALIVIDGAISTTGFLASLNPLDVESINVLKGPAASSLYGSDGANGVLIVTTKHHGTPGGKPIIHIGSTLQFESVSVMPDLQSEFGSYGGETTQIDPVTGKPYYVPYENQSFGPRYDGSMVALGTPHRYYINGVPHDTTLLVPYVGLKNAKRKFWDRGVTSQNDVSISMGDEKSSLYIGMQSVSTKGVVPNDAAQRYTARINGSRLYNNLKIDYSFNYAQRYIDQVGPGFFQNRPLYFAVLNTPAHVDLRRFQNTESDYFSMIDNYFNAYYPNPWWQINNSRKKYRYEDLISNINVAYKFTPWLDASYRLAYTSTEVLGKWTRKGVQYSAYEISDPYSVSNMGSQVVRANATEKDTSTFVSRLSGDLLVNLHKNFNNISTKLILGHSVIMDYRRNMQISATALNFDDFFNIGSRVGEATVSESLFRRNIQAAFGDATVGYKGFLFFHGDYRSSWYSTLPVSNRRFAYGGGDVSLVLSDAFPHLFQGAMSFGKIRASYAIAGQLSTDNLSPYGAYLSTNTFNATDGFPFGSVSAFTLSRTNNNPNLKDERTRETELGLELGFLRNRINFGASVYKQKTNNQTLPAATSNATGYNATLINNGETENLGIETDLRFTPLVSAHSGLRWDVGINFNYIKNRVTSLPTGNVFLGGNSYAVIGQAFPYLRVTDWVRDPKTGKVIVNANGDPTQAADLVNVGSNFAPYRLGINTTLSYKGFIFALTADYRGGNVIFNEIGQDMDFSGISAHSTYGNRERFIFPNSVYDDGTGKYVPNTNRTISNVYNFWAGTINNIGTPYVTSASYWKLREVSISYDLPASLIRKIKFVKGINVGAFGRNLLTWRPKENIWTDPEFNDNLANNDGGTTSVNQTPPTKFYGLNLNLTF